MILALVKGLHKERQSTASLRLSRMAYQADPNKSLQLTAGSCGFINVSGVAVGFGLSEVFRQNLRRN